MELEPKRAEVLIYDLLNSGLWDARTWFTYDEVQGMPFDGVVAWISRDGRVSVSLYDNGEEIQWGSVCSGSRYDRLYVEWEYDANSNMDLPVIRHTGRSHRVTPWDYVVLT